MVDSGHTYSTYSCAVPAFCIKSSIVKCLVHIGEVIGNKIHLWLKSWMTASICPQLGVDFSTVSVFDLFSLTPLGFGFAPQISSKWGQRKWGESGYCGLERIRRAPDGVLEKSRTYPPGPHITDHITFSVVSLRMYIIERTYND